MNTTINIDQHYKFNRGVYPFSPRTYEFDPRYDLVYAEYLYFYNHESDSFKLVAGILYTTNYSHLRKSFLESDKGTLLIKTDPQPIESGIVNDIINRPHWFHSNQEGIEPNDSVVRGDYPPSYWPIVASDYQSSKVWNLENLVSSPHQHHISDIIDLIYQLSTKSNHGHGHVIGDINQLASILSQKASINHSHTAEQIPDILPVLNGKAPMNHSHDSFTYEESGFVPAPDESISPGVTEVIPHPPKSRYSLDYDSTWKKIFSTLPYVDFQFQKLYEHFEGTYDYIYITDIEQQFPYRGIYKRTENTANGFNIYQLIKDGYNTILQVTEIDPEHNPGLVWAIINNGIVVSHSDLMSSDPEYPITDVVLNNIYQNICRIESANRLRKELYENSVETISVPPSSSSAGSFGKMYISGNYLYVCTGPSSWKRMQLLDY